MITRGAPLADQMTSDNGICFPWQRLERKLDRHDTPRLVAAQLAKFAPRVIRNLLEPAAGEGALVAPLIPKLVRQKTKLVCIDCDRKVRRALNETVLSLTASSFKFFADDFLTWAKHYRGRGFDCVVMNPPFGASKKSLVAIPITENDKRVSTRYVPIEAAFVYYAAKLLKPNGRMLAILPCSIVMSETVQWLRDWLSTTGAVRFVHELPPRSFPRVESRMYLFVFDRSKRQGDLQLFNHDLAQPEELKIRFQRGDTINRLDFGYHRAQSNFKRLMTATRFDWQRLGDVCSILRGDVDSPTGPKCAVHSTDFENGFWRSSKRHDLRKRSKRTATIRPSDILAKRVGRNCHNSFGRPVSLSQLPCSDCVLIIRPLDNANQMKILFALQSLFKMKWTSSLIERGTGAAYISSNTLANLMIPLSLASEYSNCYSSFTTGQSKCNAEQVERAIRRSSRQLQNLVDK